MVSTPFLSKKNLFGLILLLATTLGVKSFAETPKNTGPILRKNKIYVDGKRIRSKELEELIKQNPNGRFLGVPLGLYKYRLGNLKKDSIFQRKIQSKNFGSKFLSKKQSYRLAHAKNQFNKSLLKTPPVILDSIQTQSSTKSIRLHFLEEGYLDNTVETNTSIKSGKAKVSYFVDRGEPYKINKVYVNSQNKQVDSIYQKIKEDTSVKSGERIRIKNLLKQRNHLYEALKDQGFYDLEREHIKFSIDTTIGSNQADIHLRIAPQALKLYTISKINIHTSYNLPKEHLPKKTYRDVDIFYKDTIPYKLKSLYKLIHIKPDQPFSLKDKNETLSAIKNTKSFKPTIIDYMLDTTKSTSDHLIANIILSSKKKYAMNIGLEGVRSNIQNIGVAVNYSFTVRNVMKQLSTLEYQISVNFGKTNVEGSSNAIWNAALLDTHVRFFLPGTRLLLKRPNNLSIYIGLNARKNIGLDKIGAYASLNYKWTGIKNTEHSINFIKLQYVKNNNPSDFFKVYKGSYNVLNELAQKHYADSDVFFNSSGNISDPDAFTATALSDDNLKSTALGDYQIINDISKQKERIISDNLILSSNYSINKTIKYSPTKKKSDIYFNIELAGNLLYLLSPTLGLTKNGIGSYEIFNIPFSQYIKTDFNYVKYWWFGEDHALVFRGFVGLAAPYGNIKNIPFVKAYFSGGANDVRGWNAYSLGPGNNTQHLTFNEANFKLTASLEHRFGIVKKTKGAFFIDAGNIWDVWNEIENQESIFTSIKDLENLGISSGAGIRYDTSFLVLRLDLSFRLRDPALGGNKWVENFNFSDGTYHFAINYPF